MGKDPAVAKTAPTKDYRVGTQAFKHNSVGKVWQVRENQKEVESHYLGTDIIWVVNLWCSFEEVGFSLLGYCTLHVSYFLYWGNPWSTERRMEGEPNLISDLQQSFVTAVSYSLKRQKDFDFVSQ